MRLHHVLLPTSQLFGELHSASESNLELVTQVPASRVKGNRGCIAFSCGFAVRGPNSPEIWPNSESKSYGGPVSNAGTAKNVQKMTQVETKKSANAPAVAGTKRPALLLKNWGAYR